MRNFPFIELGELMLSKGKSVDPFKHQSEQFELFSISAYDEGKAEILDGREIGSSKKELMPNDIVLSRIVPHIRRCWVIPESNGKRQIGSGEWVVFRSNKILPSYLRYFLMSDIVNSLIMLTVKGVGGSLLRSDPKQIAKIKIPLPPLPIQERIAAILDAADTLRQKDQALLKKYDDLTQSLFWDMFGDPVSNTKGWDIYKLDDICTKITDGTHFTPAYKEKGIPFLRVTDLTESNNSKKYISEEEHLELIKRCKPEKGDILYTKNGTIGIGKIVDWDYEFSIFVSLCLIKPKHDVVNVKFLNTFLNTPFALRQALRHSKVATIKNLHLVEIKKMLIPLPSLERQNDFTTKVEEIERQKKQVKTNIKKSEDLFQSLLQKAFKGELVSEESLITS